MGFVMVVAIVLQILCRYIPALGFNWTEELARLTFIWFCFIGLAMTVHLKGHMGIDYLVIKLSRGRQRALGVFSEIVILGFSLVLTYNGFLFVMMSRNTVSPVLNISVRWFYAAVPVSFALVTLLTLLTLSRSWRDRRLAAPAGPVASEYCPVKE
jgi:TRAP-type C4-dicarboxylate transport system permease small subunit